MNKTTKTNNETQDIVIIGSGPSSLFCIFYFLHYYPHLKISIITPKMEVPRCTYGIFMSQVENTWIFEHISKTDFFSNIVDIFVNCNLEKYSINNGKFNENLDGIIKVKDRYGLVNNDLFFFKILKKIEDSENARIILGCSTQITKNKNKNNIDYSVYYYNKQKILNTIKTKFVIEGCGNYKPIGIKYKKFTNIYRQPFVGYKIKLSKSLRDIGFDDKCVLVDWCELDNKNNKTILGKPSFCYILPLNDNILLIEETILIINQQEIENYGTLNTIYEELEKRLLKRINKMGIKDYSIYGKEINTIVLNKSIPRKDSKSFGIGQCGNMINITSGYTLGYNIYHMKEICDKIAESNFDMQKTYEFFWNFNRFYINKINSVGQKMLNSFSGKEIAEFHKNYFINIVNNNNYNHRIMFLNCDSKLEIMKLIKSYKGYMEFPFKFIFRIGKCVLGSLFSIVE